MSPEEKLAQQHNRAAIANAMTPQARTEMLATKVVVWREGLAGYASLAEYLAQVNQGIRRRFFQDVSVYLARRAGVVRMSLPNCKQSWRCKAPKAALKKFGDLIAVVKRLPTKQNVPVVQHAAKEALQWIARYCVAEHASLDTHLRDVLYAALPPGLDRKVECSHCGKQLFVGLGEEFTSASDGDDYCDDCADYMLVYSEYEHGYILAGSAVHACTTRWACETQQPDAYVSERHPDFISIEGQLYNVNMTDGTWYIEWYRDEYGYDDDDDDDDDDDSLGQICRYGSTTAECISMPKKYSTRPFIGVELEFELHGVERGKKAQQFADVLGKYAQFEEDGSLDYGFEVVTNYGYVEDLAPVLARWLDDRDLFKGVHPTHRNAGMHIHLSKKSITPLHALKLDTFVYAQENHEVWVNLARRAPTTYCLKSTEYATADVRYQLTRSQVFDNDKVCRSRSMYMQAKQAQQADRRRALNWKPTDTVEFRMFAGTCESVEVLGSMELVQGLYYFTKQATLAQLTWPAFIAWAEEPQNIKDMRHFLKYAVKQGVCEKKAFHDRLEIPPEVRKGKGADVKKYIKNTRFLEATQGDLICA